MKRILITGSRDWDDIATLESALLEHGPGVVVQGEAEGADLEAWAVAYFYGWPSEGHPADWKRFKKAAGPYRNQHMVDLGFDVCLAFPLPSSRGTWDCVNRARRAGHEPVIYKPAA